ncbi:hypothetical protein SynBIOSE41_03092 [Synechococcus sp. BIOS-E4-1]|nr:hypothetical protein SynBIOSE41_03092 [Synechococcus sp. BIOS-E4-1]
MNLFAAQNQKLLHKESPIQQLLLTFTNQVKQIRLGILISSNE